MSDETKKIDAKAKRDEKEMAIQTFNKRLRSVRSIKVAVRDLDLQELDEIYLNFTTALDEIMADKKVEAEKAEAEKTKVAEALEQLKANGVDLNLLKELLVENK